MNYGPRDFGTLGLIICAAVLPRAPHYLFVVLSPREYDEKLHLVSYNTFKLLHISGVDEFLDLEIRFTSRPSSHGKSTTFYLNAIRHFGDSTEYCKV